MYTEQQCYRVINSNCNKQFFSGEPKNSQKWPNLIIFRNLICGGLGILMSQYGQVKKMGIWLHTPRTENPDTPQTHPSASNFHEYHSDTPGHPPDTPQTHPRHLQGTQHANRREQTPPDTPGHWQVLFEYVWRCQLASVVVGLHVVFSGDVWRVSLGWMGGVWGYLGVSEWYSWKSEALGCVWGYLGSQSLQYGVKSPFW